MLQGILIVNKPSGMTSHDVVAGIRRAARIRQVGHTGTLDPMATGVLTLCLGKATRIARFLQADDKEYEAEMLLGMATDTQDITGRELERKPIPPLNREDVERVAAQFIGERLQTPPMVSARHHQGKRLYELARQGVEVPREARPITLWEMKVLSVQLPRISFRVCCSKGTYVRTLCQEFGQMLGTVAVMSALKRTRCGAFSLEDSQDLQTLNNPEVIENSLRSMNEALGGYPAIRLQEQAHQSILHGKPVYAGEIDCLEGAFQKDDLVRVLHAKGSLLAMAQAEISSELLSRSTGEIRVLLPVRVLAEPEKETTIQTSC